MQMLYEWYRREFNPFIPTSLVHILLVDLFDEILGVPQSCIDRLN